MNTPDATDITRIRILNLWDEGKDTYDIAQEIGCSESVVANHLARLFGKTQPHPKFVSESQQENQRLRAGLRDLRARRPA
jgi:DNA-binding NarL/FixJ family response regulator